MVNKPDSNKARLKRHRRVRGKISGTPERPRLNVFRSAKHIYAQLIDDIKALQPNAKICVQSILPVSAERSETDEVYNNTKIENLNNMIINMSAEKGIPYLNAAEAFKDDTGALPADKTPDGIHLTAAACKEWRMYIKTHVMQ